MQRSQSPRWMGVTIFLALGVLTSSACVTRGDVDALRRGQDDILRAVARIEAGQRAPAPRPQPAQQAPAQPSPSEVMAYPVGRAAQRGPSDAWVTIIAIEDFECTFCARVSETLKAIQQKYKDDVRIVFKHLPLQFHARAMPTAVAAQCAHEQRRFWEYYDLIFAHADKFADSDLLAYAKAAKLDINAFKKCLNGRTARAQVTSDMTEAANFGVSGTPAFFINGKFLNGAQPMQNFERVIDAELKVAKDSGMAKSKYYAQAVEGAGKKAL